jgi:osmotically-inducible protein OsmY
MSDNHVIETVRARYERDPRLDDHGELAISERDGTVTLRGTVRSLHQRRVEIDLAKSVDGVRAIEDELVVDPRDHSDDTRSGARRSTRCSPTRTCPTPST